MTSSRLPRRRIAISIAAALALYAIASPRAAHAQRDRVRFGSDYRSSIDTTFAFDKNGSINVTAGSGDVTITGWSRDQIHVHAVSENSNIRLDASTTRMTLELASGSRGSDTHFEVSVPYGVHVMVRAASGDISVRGTRGEVEAHAQSGDIDVEDVTTRLDVNTISGGIEARTVTGDVDINTTSGDVKITDLRGNADVGTVSGDVELRGLTSKTVRAKTTSGDVTFDGLIDPAGRYDLATHSGDVRLHVQRDASAQLTVATWNGGLNSEFPITLKPGEHDIGSRNAKRYTFTIGGGAARISAETFSGDITISSNGHGAAERR
ncbi:MAG TPA: DUF4097 family beta strand repeat-containing protein [Gemmatimonadaceae bacterium]